MIIQPIKYFLYVRKSSESEDRQVASIPSQIEELEKLTKQQNLTIVSVLSEEKTAKAPGRPVFTRMIEDIHKGVANGIICWKLDRLARNPIDGGTIIWMLQRDIIRHIKTFQRNYYPQDNTLFMHLEFGMANQFILDLSVNTKRGQRNRIKEGWLPHKPPLGYLSNKYNLPNYPPIYKDPEKYSLIKELWHILINKGYSIEVLYERALSMGLKTDKGNVVNRSSFYPIFRNPFYHGYFKWNKELYPGKHEPMISKAEFDLAQNIIDNRTYPKPQHHIFAFTGLIRCGQCGASITAEKKTKYQKNGNMHRYTYYRCTKRIDPKCAEKPIREENLENQIMALLGKIEIPPSFHQWAIKHLKEEQKEEQIDRDEIVKSHQRSMNKCIQKLDNLFNMRISEEISAEEYAIKKNLLLEEKQKYEQLIADSHQRVEKWLERAESLFSFAETARNRFKLGSLEDKREILSCLGSNLTLTNRILRFNVDKSLAIFKEFAPEVQTLHNRLEPLKNKPSQGFWEDSYAKNEKWGG